LEKVHLRGDQYLFPSLVACSHHVSTREYTRIVHHWVEAAGLDSSAYDSTHSMRSRHSVARSYLAAMGRMMLFAFRC
jgi:hypothetical protein